MYSNNIHLILTYTSYTYLHLNIFNFKMYFVMREKNKEKFALLLL